MTPKDNIIETVPLSAIRKVIELDAQDAREIRAVAIQMRETLERILAKPADTLYVIQQATAAINKAREIL